MAPLATAPGRGSHGSWATPARASILGVCILTALLHHRVLFQDQVYYYRDIHLQWLPQAEAFVRCFHAGSWPVWNPWVSFGQPFLANP